MVKSGDIVRVKVLEVDVPRKRIALTLRLDDELGAKPERAIKNEPRGNFRSSSSSPAPRKAQQSSTSGGGALADALRRAADKNKGANPVRRMQQRASGRAASPCTRA